MGIASWRARSALRSYAYATTRPATVLKKVGAGATTVTASSTALNEVGVTDAVMSTLWCHSPQDATYAITSQAEATVLGGDLAIVDASNVIHVYQSKIVESIDAATDEYVLKSAVTHAQASLLNGGLFSWNGRVHSFRGYLALYQRQLRVVPGTVSPSRSQWWKDAAKSEAPPRLGAVYYWDMMSGSGGNPDRMASGRGIMAAPIPVVDPTKATGSSRVPVASSWPWEYGIANAWRGPMPTAFDQSGITLPINSLNFDDISAADRLGNGVLLQESPEV